MAATVSTPTPARRKGLLQHSLKRDLMLRKYFSMICYVSTHFSAQRRNRINLPLIGSPTECNGSSSPRNPARQSGDHGGERGQKVGRQRPIPTRRQTHFSPPPPHWWTPVRAHLSPPLSRSQYRQSPPLEGKKQDSVLNVPSGAGLVSESQ